MKTLRTTVALLFVCLLMQSGTSLRANGAITSAPVALAALNTAYTQDFNTLGSQADGTLLTSLPPGWSLDETGGGARADGKYALGTGSSNTGDTYAFGASLNAERALGTLRSGTLVPVIGASFTNNTGQPIRTIDISYAGEQWRLGTANRGPDQLDFQIGVSAAGLTDSAHFVDVDSLDFSSLVTTGSTGALNGNTTRTIVAATIAGIDIPDGATFWIRWTDADPSGADDGLAIDDFSLTPHTGPLSTNPTATAAADPASAVPGGSTLLTVNVTPGTNPASSGVTVRANLSSIGGSPTQSFFDDGSHGDAAAGDSTFSFAATVGGAATAGAKTFAVSVRDAQGRATSTSIAFLVELPTTTAIHDIQGPGTVSPIAAGTAVMTRGIVTGVKFNGFFIQAPPSDVDADVNTSEGVFVFSGSNVPAGAVVGNLVKVIATVSEFKNTASDPDGLSATELTSPTVAVVSTGNALPAPVTLGASELFAAATPFELEKYEGMRVHVDAVETTSPTGGSVDEPHATSTSSGLFFGVLPGTPRPFREPGIQTPLPVPSEAPMDAHPPVWDGNYERIGVDTFSVFTDPAAAAVFPPPAGATLEVTTGVTVTNITGPLDYSFRSYIVDAEGWNPPAVAPGSQNRSVTAVSDRHDGEFTVASMNTERFFDTVNDPESDAVLTDAALEGRLRKISLVIRDVLKMPDIIGVEEMENLANLQRVADQVNADAALNGQTPDYRAFLEEGNDVGGIDSGFLVRSDRVDLTPGHFTVTQYGKDWTFDGPGTCGATPLPACLNDRPPLVLDAKVLNAPYEPYPVTVIVNHLRSLSGIDGTDGFRIRTKRRLQAEYLARLIRAFQDQGKHVVSVGDYNAFDVNDGYVDVVGIAKGAPAPANEVTQDTTLTSADLPNPALVDLVDLAPASERYSFLFDGNAQELDHILATQDVPVNRVEYGRTNADFPESYRGDFTRPERVSDHDPIVAYFNTPDIDTTPPALNLPSDIVAEGNTTGGAIVTFTATAHDGIDGDLEPVCSPPSGALFALGTTEVSCIATDAHGNFSTGTFHVTVVDTTAPTVTSIAATPSEIWPVNKLMIPVVITVDAADAVSTPASRIVSVAADDGATAMDAQITGALTAAVRADRRGNGVGRTYTFTVETKDAAGNTTTSTIAVFVPHDQRN